MNLVTIPPSLASSRAGPPRKARAQGYVATKSKVPIDMSSPGGGYRMSALRRWMSAFMTAL